ncbi:hypothetical protein ACJJTC_004299 [Scirpophaga incertulas]
MRTILPQKALLLCCGVTILFLLYMLKSESEPTNTYVRLAYHKVVNKTASSLNAINNLKVLSSLVNRTDEKPSMKYILQWTSQRDVPFVYMGVGQEESSHYYPVCSNRFDGFFNWTWTFRLDSEVRWGYMAIRDSKNVIVGPKKIMHWIKLEDMDPVSDEFRNNLKTKKIAAACTETNEYCRFCEILNNPDTVKATSIIENFRDWWDNPKFC